MADRDPSTGSGSSRAVEGRSGPRIRPGGADARPQGPGSRPHPRGAHPGTDRRAGRRDGRRHHAAGRSPRPPRARRNRLRRRRRQGPEEPVRVRKGLPLHQADQDGRRHPPPRRPQSHRNRRTLRRRLCHRPVDESDVDGDLQDSDRDKGALPDRHQPAPGGGALHHPRRRNHARGGAQGRGSRRRDQLDDHGHAGRYAGIDEGPRNGRHPRDRRHGAGAGRLQRRQAGLRRRTRATPPPTSKAVPTSPRPSATSSPARPSTTACCARRRTRWSSTRRWSRK